MELRNSGWTPTIQINSTATSFFIAYWREALISLFMSINHIGYGGFASELLGRTGSAICLISRLIGTYSNHLRFPIYRVSTRSLTALVDCRQISNLCLQTVGSISNDSQLHSHESNLCDQGGRRPILAVAHLSDSLLAKNAPSVSSSCLMLKVLHPARCHEAVLASDIAIHYSCTLAIR